MTIKRRNFIKRSVQAGTGLVILPGLFTGCADGPQETETDTKGTTPAKELFFSISLAQWSLHKALKANELDNLDFVATTKNEFGISAVEYVNQFFKDKAEDQAYLKEMNLRADDHGVKQLIIMVDGEGNLGATDDAERTTAVENHYKWLEAAKVLGCHSIRVNAAGKGTAEEVHAGAVDGLGRVAEYGKKLDLNVIVENHGGYSSNGQWLSGVMAEIDMDNCGTLPDFGNFCIERSKDGCANEYDRYKGVTELMPYAKAVSAKSHDFNAEGWETHTDYVKMLQIVKDAGYSGYIGVEYEGSELDEFAGIKATKKLLEMAGMKVS